MNIGIFEAGVHEQYLHAVSRVAAELDGTVTVFTTESKYERIESSSLSKRSCVTFKIIPSEESIRSALATLENNSSEFDVLLFVSIYGNIRQLFHYARLNLSCPSLLYVYNIKKWFASNITTQCGITGNSNRLLRRQILENIDGVIVEYPHFVPYITEQFGWKQPVESFAPVVTSTRDNKPTHDNDDQIVISVPGNVDSERRDYKTLLDAFERAFESISSRLQLRLVGPPIGTRGQAIHDRCDQLINRGFDVRTFEERLDNSEFEAQMRDSDLIISPLQHSIEQDTGEREIYGVSKGSGSVFDALRYSTPAVFPEYFLVPGYLRPAVKHYRSASDITSVINRFASDQNYRDRLTAEAQQATAKFTIDKQSDRLSKVLSTV